MKNLRIVVLTLFVSWIFVDCKKETLDPTITTTTKTTTNSTTTNPNEAANGWVYDQMKEWYLWSDLLPEKSKTNLTLVTGKDGEDDIKKYYFYSILNDYPNIDRFSWIRENITDLTNSLSGISTAFGFSRTAVYLDNTQTDIVFFISNVTL